MATYAGPDTSESGLVLYLDAGNTKSFDKSENLIINSEDLSTASWTKQNTISLAYNVAESPTGTFTADSLTRIGSNDYIFQTRSFTGTLTFSCWVRTVSG